MHLPIVYRRSVLFPVIKERKIEPKSVVDETFAREHQVISNIPRLQIAGGLK